MLKKMFFKNPVILAQASEAPFVHDKDLGHTMPHGQDFIGEADYIGLENVIAFLKSNKKEVILNIGDSSTSGWDSNIITQNRERVQAGLSPLSAFFRYKTYSDFLRIFVGEEYYVINAGVPAHTSLQGSKRLNVLLHRFRKEGIRVKWVTAYYGNNDSVWDHNREDKEWVGKRKAIVATKQLLKRIKRNSPILTRVSPVDYKNNIQKIVQTCKIQDINVVIIEPVTPIYWKPGTRVHNEELERKYYLGAEQVYKLLDEALDLWQRACNNPYSELKETLLQEVREKDYVVPRIKRDHLQALRTIVSELQVPYVQIDLDRSENDIRFFLDYCHPIGLANELIAKKLVEIISGKTSATAYSQDMLTVETKTVHNPMHRINLEIPTATYTLY